jgi:type I restriction enzyme S subunit
MDMQQDVIYRPWKKFTIGEIFELVNGLAFKPSDWKQSGTPIIRIQNLNDLDAPVNYFQGQVTERNKVATGDLLFAWSGTLGSSFGARIWHGLPGVLNQHIFKVLIDERIITKEFALLAFSLVEQDIAREAHGFKSSFVHIKKSDLQKVVLQIPPVSEQRTIAAVLSDIDGLIFGLDKLIAKKRDLKQAAMQQLLTGKTRLPGFGGEWDIKELSQIVETQITDGPHLTPKFVESGIPFLSVNNLVENKIDLSNLRYVSKKDDSIFSRKCKPKKGDILFGKAASVGKVAVVDIELDFNIWSPIALIRVGANADAHFIYYQLLGADCTNQIALFTNSSSQGNIGMTEIGRIKLRMPLLPEQTAIAAVLTDMDAEISALETRLDKTRALKQGMMQELLTGRTRLV